MDSRLRLDGIVFDAHCDTLTAALGKRGLAERLPGNQVDLPRLIEGGVTAQIFSICLERYNPPTATKLALCVLDFFYNELAANDDRLCLATSVDHIEAAQKRGKVAAVLSFESVEPLQGDLALCRMFYRLGLRSIGLTHNRRNDAADGVGEIRTGGGLSTYGVALVEEMNRLGMVIDVAHLAPRGLEDVLSISKAPVIDSHTGVTALSGHRRNLSDAQLEAIALGGGVVCVCFVPNFLEPDNRNVSSIDRALDHIDHAVRIAGIDHVGIGSDFDGMDDLRTEGLEDAAKMPAIAAGLRERAYCPDDVRKIMGGNLMRVFRQVMG